ncbi:hypothetical protein [Bradyrhizobium sp. SYSU BS000235]|uniref:hypothetical protein n=1 Tax=Bradyrhizobium sp. SYSU BS000235 TaxID=3411332 RepID=UPI003C7264BB
MIGAGFIGGEIAKKLDSEGFDVFVRRRQGEKLAPLVKEIEAAVGTCSGARSMSAGRLKSSLFSVTPTNARAGQPRDAWTFETEIRPFGEKW